MLQRVCAGGIALLLAAAGCGGSDYDGPARSQVSGAVTLDGAPLPAGSITLRPDGHDGRVATAPIADGKYLIAEANGPVEGKYRVEIYGYTDVSLMSDEDPLDSGGDADDADDEAEPAEQVVPAKYNEQSELTVDINGPEVEQNFELTK